MSEVAKTLGVLNKHLQFAKEAVEAGWNATDQRGRGFNFQAALGIIENVIRENDFLIDAVYAETKKKPKING